MVASKCFSLFTLDNKLIAPYSFSVTPSAGYVQSGYALLISVISSIGVYWWLKLKKYFLHVDDTLDTFSCHGMGAILGGLLTGLFTQVDVNSEGFNGAFYGNPFQLWLQLAGILTTIGFASICTAGILLPMDFIIGIRLPVEEQVAGMDIHGHGEVWRSRSFTNPENSPDPTKESANENDPKRHSVRDVLQDAFT